MSVTALHLTAPALRMRSRSHALASFITAGVLQIAGLSILTIVQLLDISLPPPPEAPLRRLFVGVRPPDSVRVSVVTPVTRHRSSRAPSVSRYVRLAPPTVIPDRIRDSLGWDDVGPVGSAQGDTFGIWGPVLGAPPAASETTEPEPIRPGGRVRPPEKTRHVDPVYPELARVAGVEGVVILEAIIDPRGRVQNVKVLRSIPLLDAAAIAAVERWEYEPTLLNGVPVPVVMTVTVRFVRSQPVPR